MKSSDLIVLGLAGLAVYMIASTRTGTTGTSGLLGTPVRTPARPTETRSPVAYATDWVAEIFDMGGQKFGNGWQYFTNGVAISPQGDYYKDGQMVWTAGTITA